MKNLSTKKLREEVHSNLTLVSSVLSLVVFTIILFIYNNINNPASIEFCNSLSVSLCFLSAGAGIILSVLIILKKKTDLTEYAVFSFLMSAVFYLLKGITLTAFVGGLENALIIAVIITAVYWAISIVHHCFLKDKMTPNYILSVVLIVVFLLIPVAVVVYNYIVSPVII